MDTIECGTGACSMRVDGDGICTTVYSGLLLPENFPRLAARAMQAGADRHAKGLLEAALTRRRCAATRPR